MCGKILLMLMATFGAALIAALLFLGVSSESASMPAMPNMAEPQVAQPSGQCVFTWASQDMPDVTEQVLQAMEDAGIEGIITVNVSAYGEDCTDQQTNTSTFGAMQTDFYISLEVDDLADRAALGDQLAAVIDVVAGFPVEVLQGPNPGYLNVSFFSDTSSTYYYLSRADAEAARQRGLSGEELLDELE